MKGYLQNSKDSEKFYLELYLPTIQVKESFDYQIVNLLKSTKSYTYYNGKGPLLVTFSATYPRFQES
jgi:hypothetical protein